ncbi:MAG: hypothetical protein JZU53_06795 [Paludibacter sp.]|nr:hypothetical protein [Paludibacter sp.]
MKKRKLCWTLFTVGLLVLIMPGFINHFTVLSDILFDYMAAMGLALIVSTPFAMVGDVVSKKQK